jgi:hypothetical protein
MTSKGKTKVKAAKAMDERRAREAKAAASRAADLVRFGRSKEQMTEGLLRQIAEMKDDRLRSLKMAAARESQLKDDLARAADSVRTWSYEYDRELKARHEAESVALQQRDYARVEVARVNAVCRVEIAKAVAKCLPLVAERDAYRQVLVYVHRLAVSGAARHPEADVLFSVIADEAVGQLMEFMKDKKEAGDDGS